MSSLELAQPASPAEPGATITVVAWNIERCKRVEESAEAIQAAGADVVLALEMDWGCARSGQRHATRDLAAALGFGYVYGVEFVELGLGDPYETETCAGQTNEHGLHGNAILSRFPILDPVLIPLDDDALWYVTSPKGDGQYRVGGRNAIGAQIDTPKGKLTLAAAHYESESDAALRAAQTQRLLDALAETYGPGPAVIGGDLNTNAFGRARATIDEILTSPETIEPSFTAFQSAGFDWRTANTRETTTRPSPGRTVRYPQHRLDWLLTRGVHARDPFLRAALCARGDYLSDHEMIGAVIDL